MSSCLDALGLWWGQGVEGRGGHGGHSTSVPGNSEPDKKEHALKN